MYALAHLKLTTTSFKCLTCAKSYSSSNAWSMDAGWNNSCHRVWILLRLYVRAFTYILSWVLAKWYL